MLSSHQQLPKITVAIVVKIQLLLKKQDKKYIKNVTITSRSSISKFKVNKEHDENFPKEIWKALYKDLKNVRGRISLPKTWCSHFAEISDKVNPYCCINFVRHTMP